MEYCCKCIQCLRWMEERVSFTCFELAPMLKTSFVFRNRRGVLLVVLVCGSKVVDALAPVGDYTSLKAITQELIAMLGGSWISNCGWTQTMKAWGGREAICKFNWKDIART